MSHRCLTHLEAVARAATVRDLAYALDVDLTGGDELFRTVTTVRFTADAGAETFLELRPEQLLRATLNGVELPAGAFAEGRLRLAGLAASNTAVVEAAYAYTHSSQGVHRFVDPADKQVYTYAQPSITDAPGFMACFDQPDLKAPVTLSVTTDPSWLVRANSEGVQTAPGRWEFGATKPVATYLITFVAGPYVEVSDVHDGIPLGIIARASYAEVLERDAPEIFEVTKAFLDRYHELFGVRYPFGKYDQAFVPEFSWGAMEFPGCVVFRDELLFRAAVTDTERLERAAIIAHEMAHMWFGDLVTMRWWDDLWLNESFATYMGYRLVAEVTKWPQSWTRFGVNRKAWGYAADQRPSTHPIAPTEVADTDAAFANFDGISYAKGCSALRQLVAFIGDEAFLAGLRAYFDKHAWGNATLADLLGALSLASGRDLEAWARDWLRTPQVNTLRPVIEWNADGSYASVAVAQSAPAEFPTLRAHRIGLGWFDEAGTWQRTEVEVSGELTPVPQLTGVTGRGLLLNDGDLTFAKIRVDERTRAELPALLAAQPDPLARSLWWNSAWDATRDGEWPAIEFVELAAAALPADPDVTIVESIFGLARYAAGRFVPADGQQAARQALANAARTLLATAAPGSGHQLAAARNLIAAGGDADRDLLRGWLAGANVPEGLPVDAELRWAILGRLAALGDVAEDEIDAELQRDHSDKGEQEAVRVRACRPDPAAKERAFDLVVTEQGQSNRIAAAAGSGLWQPEQAELTAAYVARFFTELPRSAGRSGDMLALLAKTVYPVYAVSEDTLAAARAALAGEMHPLLRRALADETDDLARALRARQAA
ncbi:aminopeptidase N [Catellatospora bangladeshensis]|uniref:Aminopeptidase N n=1 Tax=Catellatospora bangladeshensis TaxID=310355 RepID=A0A8J3NMS7_9ACTN|nr:aminopeptidase N [Catellatospora bangladeshensis]GIF85556.1 aminopeptidase [Catellatospora bangladeshensis]